MSISRRILARRRLRREHKQLEEQERFLSVAQLYLVGIIVVLAFAGTIFSYLVHNELKQTALLYIGLPSLIAIMLTLLVQPKSAMGITLLTITLGTLMSGVVFQEGIICMVIAMPIFYVFGALVVWICRFVSNGFGRTSSLQGQILLALPIVLMSLEGTHPYLSFDRGQEVQAARIVQGSAASVEEILASPVNFDQAPPLFLQLGFPMPNAEDAIGQGLEVGAERIVPFEMQGRDGGTMHLQVVERGKSSVRFVVVENSTATGDWLALHDAVVVWQEISPTETQVTWTFRYDRLLDPAWYFGPLERYAVELAAGYLIDTVATPVE